MTTVPTINDSMYQGDSATKTIYVKDSKGNTVAITGATITYIMQTSVGTTPDTLSKTATITNASAGEATVTFAPADTSSLTPQDYYHQASMTDANGNVRVIFTGTMTINKKG